MDDRETLKQVRDRLLGLHKMLVDFERMIFEGLNGKVTSGQFLNLLLENPDFAWLRKFSTLIVEIDEMFAQKDGYSGEQVAEHLAAVRQLINMSDLDDDFVFRYQNALQQVPEAAALQAEIQNLIREH